jgi:hypothetical protein
MLHRKNVMGLQIMMLRPISMLGAQYRTTIIEALTCFGASCNDLISMLRASIPDHTERP